MHENVQLLMLAGSTMAASVLTDIYNFLKYAPRTYFWQIRSRDTSSAGELNFTKSQIVEVQRLAADSSRSYL